MALAIPFKNKPYNLFWNKSPKTALWISIAFFCLPDFCQFPIGSIYGAGVLLYFAFYVKGPNQLGLSLKIPRKAVWAMIIIVAVTIALNVTQIYLFEAAKEYYAQHPEEGPFLEKIIEYKWGFYWKPDSTIYQALSEKDLNGTLLAMRNPFIQAEILAPVFETIITFAIFFPALWRKLGYGAAFWIASSVFALLHFPKWSVLWVIVLYLVSYIMAFLYRKTGSIYPSIIFHACVNLTLDVMYLAIDWGLPYTPSGG